jgi:PadR family transcriptional regulator PadR
MAQSISKSASTSKRQSKTLDSFVLTDFSRFYILLLLFEGQKHGYQIMSSIERRLGQKISPSLVYPFLRLLEVDNLVSAKQKKIGRKTRNVYSLTASGRALCNRLFRQFTTLVTSAIEPSMEVCAHCGCHVFKDTYIDEINGRKTAFCCRYCAASYKRER